MLGALLGLGVAGIGDMKTGAEVQGMVTPELIDEIGASLSDCIFQ